MVNARYRCWVDPPKARNFEYSKNFFWRVMVTVPESCPKIALRSETSMLGMKWRVWREKIMLLVRIKMHDESVLARQVYEESKARGCPALGDEAL